MKPSYHHAVIAYKPLTIFKIRLEKHFDQNSLHFLLVGIFLLAVSIVSTPLSFAESILESPLKQIKKVPVLDVKCANDFVLILKTSNLIPACVKQSSVSPLIIRGWAVMSYKQIENQQYNLTVPNGNIPKTISTRDNKLVFLISSASSQYDDNLHVFTKYLKNGDYLMVAGYENSTSEIEQKMQKIKSLVNPGVNVVAIRIYSKIEPLVNRVPNLPRGFDYIGYDYEEGDSFSPEFTTNETTSIKYFDEARSAISQYNLKTAGDAKLIIMPPYGQLRNAKWDWGMAAKHTDIISIQFQAFMKDDKFLNYVTNTVAQIKQESPSTKMFIQLSLVSDRGTPQDNLNAISMLYPLPIDGFLVFYHPSQTSDLVKFFNQIPNR